MLTLLVRVTINCDKIFTDIKVFPMKIPVQKKFFYFKKYVIIMK